MTGGLAVKWACQSGGVNSQHILGFPATPLIHAPINVGGPYSTL